MPTIRHINLKRAKAEGVLVTEANEGYELTIPADGGKLIFSGLPGFLGGVRWKGMMRFEPVGRHLYQGQYFGNIRSGRSAVLSRQHKEEW